jgi:hypothetical protein
MSGRDLVEVAALDGISAVGDPAAAMTALLDAGVGLVRPSRREGIPEGLCGRFRVI